MQNHSIQWSLIENKTYSRTKRLNIHIRNSTFETPEANPKHVKSRRASGTDQLKNHSSNCYSHENVKKISLMLLKIERSNYYLLILEILQAPMGFDISEVRKKLHYMRSFFSLLPQGKLTLTI